MRIKRIWTATVFRYQAQVFGQNENECGVRFWFFLKHFEHYFRSHNYQNCMAKMFDSILKSCTKTIEKLPALPLAVPSSKREKSHSGTLSTTNALVGTVSSSSQACMSFVADGKGTRKSNIRITPGPSGTRLMRATATRAAVASTRSSDAWRRKIRERMIRATLYTSPTVADRLMSQWSK